MNLDRFSSPLWGENNHHINLCPCGEPIQEDEELCWFCRNFQENEEVC